MLSKAIPISDTTCGPHTVRLSWSHQAVLNYEAPPTPPNDLLLPPMSAQERANWRPPAGYKPNVPGAPHGIHVQLLSRAPNRPNLEVLRTFTEPGEYEVLLPVGEVIFFFEPGQLKLLTEVTVTRGRSKSEEQAFQETLAAAVEEIPESDIPGYGRPN